METIENQKLREALGGEIAEFTIKADRTCLPGQAILLIVLGVVFLFCDLILAFAILLPFFLGGKIPAGEAWFRFAPTLILAPVLGIFLILGLYLLAYGLYRLLAPGSWYVGTPTRLIMMRKNRQRSVGWSEFSDQIDTKPLGGKTALTLTLKSTRMVYSRYGGRSVPRKICMAGIDDAARIEQIIRKRISASATA